MFCGCWPLSGDYLQLCSEGWLCLHVWEIKKREKGGIWSIYWLMPCQQSYMLPVVYFLIVLVSYLKTETDGQTDRQRQTVSKEHPYIMKITLLWQTSRSTWQTVFSSINDRVISTVIPQEYGEVSDMTITFKIKNCHPLIYIKQKNVLKFCFLTLACMVATTGPSIKISHSTFSDLEKFPNKRSFHYRHILL
jgi:hypothetical protein